MADGGYSLWEWMTGVPLVNAAGQAVGQGGVGGPPPPNFGSRWGSDAFWYGGNSASHNTNPNTVTPEQIKEGERNVPPNSWVRDTNGTVQQHREKRYQDSKEKERRDLVGPSQDALDNPPGDYQWPNGETQPHTYGDKRDPFKPLPGTQHSPDPNADPFKKHSFSDPHSDALLGLIKGYDQLRSQGATREMALTTLHYQPPQQMAMGGGGTGTGGGQQDSGGSGDAFPQYGDQPNSDDWGSSKPYTEWTGIPIINPFNDQDLPITGKGPKIFPEEHLYPQQDLQRQYYSDREKLLGGTEQQRFDAEGSLRNKREQFRDATKQGQTTVQKSLRKSQRDEKLNDRRVQVDTGGK